jgi:hypothetical protein
MTDTTPERTAGPLELARQAARMTPCGCGALAGHTCDGEGGMHLARFAVACQRGLMPEPAGGSSAERPIAPRSVLM